MFLHLSVSHYVQRGVCPVHAGVHPPGQTPPTPLGQTPRTATAVDGTHPTGMLSCYHPQRSCGKVIFSQVCVKNSDHGGVSTSAHAGIHTHPCPEHAGIHTTPAQCMLGYIPLPSACWDRHGYCCGRYASYWNAFLL